MTTIIEIAAIRPPKEGKKSSTVISKTGQSFLMWPKNAAKLEIDRLYEIEVEDFEFNERKFRKIMKAKEVMPTADVPKSTTDTRPQSSATAGADQELAFVSSTLNAFIAAGKIGMDARELGQATTLLRMLWSHTFGEGGGTFRASAAFERRAN